VKKKESLKNLKVSVTCSESLEGKSLLNNFEELVSCGAIVDCVIDWDKFGSYYLEKFVIPNIKYEFNSNNANTFSIPPDPGIFIKGR
jgi:hypothetical protein